jgi:hypothetical protein
MAAVMSRATRASAFESRAAAVTAAAVRTPTTVAASSTAAERPLEAGTRTSADACGIPRKIFTARGRIGRARCARFTGQEGDVFLEGGCFGSGFTGGRSKHIGFGVEVLGFERLFVAVFLVSGFFVLWFSVLVFRFLKFTEGGSVFGAFLRHVGGKVGTIGRAASFHFRRFFFCES